MLLWKFSVIFVYIYFKIINISCDDGITLAFAIDDSQSMWDDIAEVKSEAKNILSMALNKTSNLIKDYVLVTINDPEVLLKSKTTSPSIFVKYLNSLRIKYGDPGCAEKSLTGIELALQESRPGSVIYVFTDASAKDYRIVDRVNRLCEKKQIQVVFVLTGHCGYLHTRDYMVYHEIAAASSGQVIHVNKGQVHTVMKTIQTMMVGNHSPIKRVVQKATESFTPTEFTVDEKTDYLIISTSGKNVNLRMNPGPQTENIAWNDNYKVVKVRYPQPGTYYIDVKGDSSTSVVIYARTDFTFEHGFSTLEPTSIKDTSKQPIAGQKQHLSFNVTDAEQSVYITSAKILDMNENVISTMPLKKTYANFYTTNAFESPAYMFKIAVTGVINTTGEVITRISRTAVEPLPPLPPPVPKTIPATETDIVKIVEYGSATKLSCKVSAHPEPKIEWFDMDGTLCPSQSSLIEFPLYVSYIKLSNIKQSKTYICKATNTEGSSKNKTEVRVRPVFNVPTSTGATTSQYAKDVKIRCNIKSYLPITIKWFHSGKELRNTRVHTISPDGKELTLKSIDLGMEGTYTCEASLNTEPTLKQADSTVVTLTGLSRPEVTYAATIMHIKNFTIICRVNGVPKPTITWYFQPKGSNVLYLLQGSGEEFNIPEPKLQHSGIYKCTAKNALGQSTRDLNVEIEEPPVITNDRSFYFGVEGDTILMIPCNVTGFPDPAILWKIKGNVIKKGTKYDIKENILYIRNPKVKSDTGNITCEAYNKLGTAKKTFETFVTDSFPGEEINTSFDTHTFSVDGRKTSSVNLKCNLVTLQTSSVRWYRNGVKTNKTSDTYIIKDPTVYDDGNYTCRVNTDYGPKSENFVVYVGYAPSFKNTGPSLITVDWRDDAILDCSEEHSNPQAKIEWMYNGKKVDNLNDNQEIDVTDWGQYTCIVSNVHGRIQKIFNVITSGCYLKHHMATQNMPLLTQVNTPSMIDSISNSGIALNKNDKVKLSCQTGNNLTNSFQLLPSKTEIIAECDTEDKFIFNGETYRYKDLQCKTRVEPSVIQTSEQCSGPNTEMLRIGFPVNGFLDTYSVCYDRSINVPMYAHSHIVLTKSGNGVESLKFKWSSWSSGISDRNSTGGYTCGSSSKCCYEKGQLLNVDELPFSPAQGASFIDNINSIAIWNPCDETSRMSWKTFEKEIISLYGTLPSWTGASNYVNKNSGLVPRYLWKIYHGEPSVMVYVNDESPVASDIKCTEPCDIMIEATDTFLYCCTLEEFSKAFKISTDEIMSL